jgi:2-oxo-4-hydroxy-4-carboxy-5-ureidoimidazoline decarboxylase
MKIDELNSLDRDAFVDVVGPVFEHSPWIAERTWAERPFPDRKVLHEALCRTMYGATRDEQVRLIRAHPDLVGQAARTGSLTPESAGEQRAAGLGGLSVEEIALFDRYNEAYRERFGFPFVICARENKKESILAAFPVRLENAREDEIDTALAEIARIARFRIDAAISDD